MPRVPSLPPSALDASRKADFQAATEACDEFFGDVKVAYTDPKDGAFIGPFAPLFASSSKLIDTFLKYAGALGELPLKPSARETAILAVGSLYEAEYELDAHRKIAATTSLSAAQIDAVSHGNKPSGSDALDEEEEVAFELAMALAKGRGKLGDGLWERAVKAIGRESTLAVVHYTGYYTMTCVILNAVGAEYPGGRD
ncbi:hypothetical protein P7C73_g5153, partial [Tremellales sp. Uapishka_1]